MIYYNFANRGAFEYDKFVLNILQYCNESVRLERQLQEGALFDAKAMKAAVDELYESYANNSEARKNVRSLEKIRI